MAKDENDSSRFGIVQEFPFLSACGRTYLQNSGQDQY